MGLRSTLLGALAAAFVAAVYTRFFSGLIAASDKAAALAELNREVGTYADRLDDAVAVTVTADRWTAGVANLRAKVTLEQIEVKEPRP